MSSNFELLADNSKVKQRSLTVPLRVRYHSPMGSTIMNTSSLYQFAVGIARLTFTEPYKTFSSLLKTEYARVKLPIILATNRECAYFLNHINSNVLEDSLSANLNYVSVPVGQKEWIPAVLIITFSSQMFFVLVTAYYLL
jgi:hypothetical protein